MKEQTLLLIKPNATKKHVIGNILARVEEAGFVIRHLKSFTFSQELAYKFYEEHIGKEFFERLLAFMTSGMTVAAQLEKEDAVKHLRELIGDTNPEKRKPGTIRYLYADTVTENAVHASDTHDHALRELHLIFPEEL